MKGHLRALRRYKVVLLLNYKKLLIMNDPIEFRPNENEFLKSKILIIEDDKFLRDLLSQKLSREGFKSAVEDPPDLILLDLVLPGIDGFSILERIKKEAKLSSVPVLILSNLGQKEDVDRALALGAVDFMIKANFTPGEISERIKSILKKKYL